MLTSWCFYHTSVHLALFPFANMDKSGVTSTNGRTQRGMAKSSRSSHSLMGRPIDELSEKEFRARFYIPDSISI